jgi:hypothetical protein
MSPVPGQVRRCAQWLFLVDEGPAQLGIWLVGAGEVAPHDGQFGGTVSGQRPLFLGRGELSALGGQPRRVAGLAASCAARAATCAR